MAHPPRRHAAARARAAALTAAVVAALLAGLLPPAAAGVRVVDSADSAALAIAVPASVGTPGAAVSVAQGGSAAAPPAFSIRRIVNPRYRPRPAATSRSRPGPGRRPSALDHVRAQVSGRGAAASRTTLWEVVAGEQWRGSDGFQVVLTGAEVARDPGLRTARFDLRRGPFAFDAGDVAPVSAGPAVLHGMRGGVVRREPARGPQWRAFAGAPTPRPGTRATRITLAGAGVDGLAYEASSLGVSLALFDRGSGAAQDAMPGDTVPGRGVSAFAGAQAPLPLGLLSVGTELQVHSLDGARAVEGRQVTEWTYRSASAAWSLRDERGTGQARVLGVDRLAPAARRENRWNIQQRFGRGHVEAHAFGVVRDGGDPELTTRTAQLGVAANPGGSAWRAGLDAGWSRRGASGANERRLALSTGRVGRTGRVVTARLEEVAAGDGESRMIASGETSVPIRGRGRLEVAPRLGWSSGRASFADVAAQAAWPLPLPSARLSVRLAVGAARDDATRGAALREVSIAVSLAPRARDRGDFELVRRVENGRADHEYTAAYEAMAERYPWAGGAVGRDSTRIVVRVVRAGNGSGVANVLVSLDGRELRFTDDDGCALFDRVPQGVHVVAVEERSLTGQDEVVGASRVFVTVERGRRPEPARFEIARPVRRVKF